MDDLERQQVIGFGHRRTQGRHATSALRGQHDILLELKRGPHPRASGADGLGAAGATGAPDFTGSGGRASAGGGSSGPAVPRAVGLGTDPRASGLGALIGGFG